MLKVAKSGAVDIFRYVLKTTRQGHKTEVYRKDT